MKKQLLFLLLQLPLVLVAQSNFKTMLHEMKLQYTQPVNWKTIAVQKGKSMDYQHAIKHKDQDFEVRYVLKPEEFGSREEVKAGMAQSFNFQNVAFLKVVETVQGVGKGGNSGNVTELPKASVKQEFGADWGSTAFIEADGGQFAQNYTYIMVISLYKTEVGNVYIFFLSNDKQHFNKQIGEVFHALKFL